jgi:hypothetical protein
MTRRARMPISLDMLKMLLDLPPHITITGAYQTPTDQRDHMVSLSITGPYCPEVAEGDQAPIVQPEYVQVEPLQAKLRHIHGLDT